ncbi:putative HTH-type transcriptional regulator YusO [compost metagenome]
MSVSEISRRLKVTSPTVSQMINDLLQSGYVARNSDRKDRRVTEIRLTEQGEQLAARAINRYFDFFRGLHDELGSENSEQLIELLHQVFDYFERTRIDE